MNNIFPSYNSVSDIEGIFKYGLFKYIGNRHAENKKSFHEDTKPWKKV